MRGALSTCFLAAGLAAGALGLSGPAAADPGLAGTYWQTDDGKYVLRLESCGGESLCADLVWLLRPLDKENGEPKRDKHNPAAALRDRPVCGLRLVTGLERETEDRWGNARFYNPDDGNSYNANMRRRAGGELAIRAYLGVEMLGKTLRMRPVTAPTESCAARAEDAMADIENYFAQTPGSRWASP